METITIKFEFEANNDEEAKKIADIIADILEEKILDGCLEGIL